MVEHKSNLWRKQMRIWRIGSALLLALSTLSPAGLAQEKPKSEEKPRAETHESTAVKVQLVFHEMDGNKIVKSLPYTLQLNALNSPELIHSGWTKLRMGSKVPIHVGANQISYQDVGTNIDARAANPGDGRFLLYISFERSWVDGEVAMPLAKDASAADNSGHVRNPIIRQFKSELDLKVRDGQTVEGTTATDPLTGKVIRVEVT